MKPSKKMTLDIEGRAIAADAEREAKGAEALRSYFVRDDGGDFALPNHRSLNQAIMQDGRPHDIYESKGYKRIPASKALKRYEAKRKEIEQRYALDPNADMPAEFRKQESINALLLELLASKKGKK